MDESLSISRLPNPLVERGRIEIRRYWEVPLEDTATLSENRAREEFKELLNETLRLHLISDVPVGALLSGGIDSSSIVALAAKHEPQYLKTFFIGYDSAENELGYARTLAQHLQTEYKEVQLTQSSFTELLPKIIWNMEEPVADAPSVSLSLLSEVAGRKVAVVLSGEGADEILGGHPIYNRMLALDQINRLPFARLAGGALRRWAPAGKLRKNGAMLGIPLESRYRAAVIFSIDEIARFMPDRGRIDDPYGSLPAVYGRFRELPSLTRMSYVDLTTWLPNDLLLKADRMSMAHSLELRVPFLDHKLVEFASRLPAEFKIHRGTNKYLLKRIMEPLLPPIVVNRAKKGFPIPTRRWFRGGLAGFTRDRLLAVNGPCLSFFPRREVVRVLESHRYRDCSDQIYALLVFDKWYRTFITAKYRHC